MRSLQDNNELLTSDSPPLIHLKSLLPSTPLESDSEQLLVWCFAGAGGAGAGAGGAWQSSGGTPAAALLCRKPLLPSAIFNLAREESLLVLTVY